MYPLTDESAYRCVLWVYGKLFETESADTAFFKYTYYSKEKHSDVRKNREKMVIAFRSDRLERKGCKYIYEALQKLNAGNKIELLCVGNENVPSYIKDKYHTTELGWVDDESEIIRFFQSCDIFLMPSLAETFGVMAIEAMAEIGRASCRERV